MAAVTIQCPFDVGDEVWVKLTQGYGWTKPYARGIVVYIKREISASFERDEVGKRTFLKIEMEGGVMIFVEEERWKDLLFTSEEEAFVATAEELYEKKQNEM